MPLSIKKSFETDFEFNYFLEGFGWSMGISNDSNKIYVADGTKNEILVFNKIDGVFLDRILLNVEKCIGHTHGMEIKLEKIFVVKENYDCIAIFDLDGNFIQEFGNKGLNQGDFDGPQNLEIYQDKVFVTDSGNNRIQIFDLDGNFLQEFGTSGKEPGKFDWNTGMKIYNENIFVTDSGNNRIQIFDLDGNFLQEFKANFKIPHQLIIIDNILYVLDTYNYKVKIFSLIDYDEFQNNDNTSILLAGILLTITIIIVFIFLRKKLVDN